MSNPFGALETGDSDSENDEKIERQPKKENKDTGKIKVAPVKTEPLPKSAADLKARETKVLKEKKELPGQKKYDEKHSSNNNNSVPVKSGDKPKREKREFERRSGTGRGKEVAKSGAGGNNWGKDSEKEVIADTTAAVTDAVDDEAPVTGENVTPIEPEEPQGMTLEEYEAIKASKRQGKAFEELTARTVELTLKGKAYKKEEKKEEFLIKMSAEEAAAAEVKEKAKKEARAGTQRIELTALPTAPKREISDSSRGSGRGGASRGGAQRGGRGSTPRQDGARPEGSQSSPRGGNDRPRGSYRGSNPGGRGGSFTRGGARGGINTQDESAFPKLGA